MKLVEILGMLTFISLLLGILSGLRVIKVSFVMHKIFGVAALVFAILHFIFVKIFIG